MNILQATTHLNLGGISSYLVVLGNGLKKRGHTLSVLSAGGQKTDELEANGIRCFTLPIRTKSEMHPKLWMALPGFLSLIEKEKFDLVHAHTRVTQVFAAMAGRFSGLPFVSTAHGFYKPRWGRRVLPCWGEHVVAVSELVAQDLRQAHGVSTERLSIVHNALDIEDLEKRLKAQDPRAIRAEYGIPEGAFVVGCISRLVRDKGQEYLIEALHHLRDFEPHVFLFIVGDGREKENLLRLAKKYSLEKRLRFLDGVQDTTKILSILNVFAHPATYREGFGLSMAEAMMAGKPVVATRIPAIHTLFKENEEAVLVPPKDAPALAAAIKSLAINPAQAEKIARNGHALASRICRSERQAEQMEKIYKDVLTKWKKKKN